MSSPDFRRGFTSATLRVDTFTIQLTPSTLNDSTVSGTLPSSVSGVVTTEVIVDGVRFPTRPLQLTGFRETRILPPGVQAFDGPIYALPQGGEAQLLGSDRNGNGTILNLDRQTFTTVVRHVNAALRGAGPGNTYLPWVFLFRRVTGLLESWDVRGIGTNLGAHPELGPRDNDFLSYTTQLSPNAWLLGDEGDYHYLIRRPDANSPYEWSERIGGSYFGVQFSPRGDRAAGVGRTGLSDGNVFKLESPVYALPGAEVAFRLKLGIIGSVAFTSDGATLIATGSDGPNWVFKHLQFLDATTGIVRADTTFDTPILTIGVDPYRSLIVVALRGATGYPLLHLYSATTFKLVRTLTVPNVTGNRLVGVGDAAIAFSRINGLYLYVSQGLGSYGVVFNFALPPVQ